MLFMMYWGKYSNDNISRVIIQISNFGKLITEYTSVNHTLMFCGFFGVKMLKIMNALYMCIIIYTLKMLFGGLIFSYNYA